MVASGGKALWLRLRLVLLLPAWRLAALVAELVRRLAAAVAAGAAADCPAMVLSTQLGAPRAVALREHQEELQAAGVLPREEQSASGAGRRPPGHWLSSLQYAPQCSSAGAGCWKSRRRRAPQRAQATAPGRAQAAAACRAQGAPTKTRC